MKLKLKDYRDILLEGKYQDSEKSQFREDIRNFGRFGEHIYKSEGMNQVIEGIKNLTERAQSMALDEAGEEGWFEAVTVKKNMNEVKKDAQLFEKTAKEMGALQQRLEALYEDIAHKIGRYYEVGDLAGKSVLPADNDYTANGEEEEEEEERYDEQGLAGEGLYDPEPYMGENFSMNTGNQNLPQPGNQNQTNPGVQPVPNPTNPGVPDQGQTQLPESMNDLNAGSNPQGATLPLGSLMSDEEVNNVKENYWTLQGAQNALMEDDADEDTPGMADVNQATGWKARNESRAEFFHRMKEQLETL